MHWLIVDMDGTLANASRRAAFLPDWDAFHSDAINDEPYHNVVKLVNHLSNFYQVLILTGRPDKYKSATLDWLIKHKVESSELSLRPGSDWTSDVECKWNQAVRFFGSEEAVLENTFMVIDDRDKVVEMWRNKGLTCLQPRLGDY